MVDAHKTIENKSGSKAIDSKNDGKAIDSKSEDVEINIKDMEISAIAGPFQKYMERTPYGKGTEESILERIILAYSSWKNLPDEKRMRYRNKYLSRIPKFRGPRIDLSLFDDSDINKAASAPKGGTQFFRWIEGFLKDNFDDEMKRKSNAEIAIELAKKWEEIHGKERRKMYLSKK